MKKLIYTAALVEGIMGDAKAPHLVHSNAHSGNLVYLLLPIILITRT